MLYTYPTLSTTNQTFLAAPCTLNEITKALFDLSPLKAPGPDGLHPLFFPKFWNLTQKSVFYYF